ncbi:MAG: Manganese containing catalase, partial [Anaerocolumna sp.]|nr:Manganese containing catalase [Anaerocolumna sp.]
MNHGLGKERINMWNYEKRLQYPVNIKNTNPKTAMFIMSQFGG